ncbi:MAG: sigma-54 dependent transcriptional regulator [Syntrophobacteraceae bacterium]|nr:sigma-54 dependent transcriptional regulator [Syntrophobacteraceae bacterium]
MNTVLIVDDERNYLLVLEELLSEEGYQVITAEGALRGLECMEDNDLDVVVTDMKMPGMDGMEFMERVKLRMPDIPIIMMTAFGSVEKAVEAMRKGAFDYILKPFKNEELKLTILKAIDHYNLVRQNRQMARELQGKYHFGNIVGKSARMQRIFELIEKVAPTRATVLITGDSGTGKELIARAIHYNSPRINQPFISVNCGALPETLLESELFGHEKGAFSGAVSQRKGRFELAHEGTLFLDEISEMSPPLQVKLLRILQEMEFERVGGSHTLKVDVRVVAASNRNLKEESANGRFRSDLYYRLNVVHVHLPSLRERKDDLPLLVNHFLAKYAKEALRESVSLSSGAMKRILDYHWPGNVRELENAIERAMILSNGSEIQAEDLPNEVAEPSAPPPGGEESRQSPEAATFIPELSPGDRMGESGMKVRQMRAMEFIKTNGFITNKYYSQLAEISERQALRELNELVESGRLLRVGKGRACRYVLS